MPEQGAPMNGLDEEDARQAAIESPCIRICSIDLATGLCTGCRRTLQEIARWSSMTPGERRRIMHELAARGRTRAATA
jgi:predicted Fe-S protein YdhL (DUF1289 family)